MKLATIEIEKRCVQASELIHAGRYEEARNELGELWTGIGKRPQLDLAPLLKAEVLLLCGTLSGWLGSAKQLDVQEKAKDLLFEALRIFQSSHLRIKVSEAQYELGMCYWRLGAYDEARVVLSEAVQGSGETELKAKILIRRTLVEVWVGRYYEAWETLKEAQALFDCCSDSVKGRWHGQMALVFRRLATIENLAEYFDRAILEYTASIYHCEQAGHERYCATTLNNLAFLLYKLGRYEEAHEHLDRSHKILERLSDAGFLAQVDETRARLLIAEGRYQEALQAIRGAVEAFERSGEQALLVNDLTIKATIQARLGDDERSLHDFRRAIKVAENAGALSYAGRAALSMIEEHGAERLSDVEIYQAYRNADRWLATTQDAEDIARLRACARIVTRRLYGPELDEYFTLPETVLKYEGRFIEQALREEGGSVTRAARRLGMSHQALGAVIKTRHQSLREKRSPEIKRRRSIITKDRRAGRGVKKKAG
ncbi:MAG TPA: tetratricopeptide repeat protein [Pyrinomonadaceae bacterium]|jgi:tetratricopeptide (TPR) repeat protein